MAWYQEAVFYELMVRSFMDSNGDGIGDLRGVEERLDHLQWLGVDCVWLPPIFDSPLRDGGYDVSDFRTVHPQVGTVDDLARLIDRVHERGMRIVSDLVMNHTSDQHAWFQEARKPGSEMRDWYVWSDDPTKWAEARIIFLDTEASNWAWDDSAGAYYWHRFFSHQPDLNYRNPAVQEAMLDTVRFWLQMGFDGFRLDAVPYLYEADGTNGENLPETHAFLKRVRAVVDEAPGDPVLLSEANQWPRDVVEYFGDGDECHMNFHFPVMPRLYMSLAQRSVTSLRTILADTPEIPAGCVWGMFLRNHDELTLEMVTTEERDFMWDYYAPEAAMRSNLGIRRRLAPLVEGDRRRIELLHGVLLALPGAPVLYYGDEIGMGDEYTLHDRDGVRTPMQWEPGLQAGFSTADPEDFFLPLVQRGGYGPDDVNVAAQRADDDSLLNWLRALLMRRRQAPELTGGTFELTDSGDDAVFAARRTLGAGTVDLVANFIDEPRTIHTDGGTDLATGRLVAPGLLELGPYEFSWVAR